jgi:hypothetical protein
MAGVDTVLHTATLHKPHVITHSRRSFVETNITGTLTLLEEATLAGVGAFVFTSTTSAFGGALHPPAAAPAVWVRKRNKKVAGPPCPAHLCVQDTRKGALWPRVAIKRYGLSKVWHAVAGMWTSMGMGAEGWAGALLWSFSSLQEVRPMRTTRRQFHVTMRSRAPSEPWLASNLFVTLPSSFRVTLWSSLTHP